MSANRRRHVRLRTDSGGTGTKRKEYRVCEIIGSTFIVGRIFARQRVSGEEQTSLTTTDEFID